MKRPRSFARGIQAGITGLLCVALAVPCPVRAGGPLIVGGPSFGTDGLAFTWDMSSPIAYRVDAGPLAVNPSGVVVVPNSQAINDVQNMFQAWENVATANIGYTNAGAIQNVPPDFNDGDVSTVTEFDAVEADCDAGNQSPIIFDANGSLFDALFGDPGVIGFASPCKLDGATGRIVSGMAVLNGIFRDGVDSGLNLDLTAAEFNEVFTHEFGHFSGLDHAQINVSVLSLSGSCPTDLLAGLPLMFPYLQCQARTPAGLPILAPDDVAWISQLYPETANMPPAQRPFLNEYGFIKGTIFFSDGITQAQGVNVIARRVSDGNPANGDETQRIAFSVASGYRFTGLPGQNVTGDNPGSRRGSRNAQLIGEYEIPVTPGSYTVEVESVDSGFTADSGVGPLDLPIPNPGLDEFWNSGESATDIPATRETITVAAGATVSGMDIILNGTPPRFDAFESAELRMAEELPRWLRREKTARELVAA